MLRNISKRILPSIRNFSSTTTNDVITKSNNIKKEFPRGKVLTFLNKSIVPQKYVNM